MAVPGPGPSSGLAGLPLFIFGSSGAERHRARRRIRPRVPAAGVRAYQQNGPQVRTTTQGAETARVQPVCLIDLAVSLSVSSLLNNYMMWTLVQKSVASLDQRFENAQDKLLESLYGTKKVLHTSNMTCVLGWTAGSGSVGLTVFAKYKQYFPFKRRIPNFRKVLSHETPL